MLWDGVGQSDKEYGMKRYAIVTGSTKGIGKAIAVRLLKEGFFVIVNYSGDDCAANLFRDEMQNYDGQYYIIKRQLSTYSDAMEFVTNVKRITKQIDCMVMNCGVTDRSEFCNITRESWEYVMNTNLNIPFYIIQGLDEMISLGGAIIFIGSLLGIHPHASSLAYAVSKAGVHQMARDLVKVFAERHITVKAIAPGFVDTSWQANKSEEQRKRIENKIALGRFGYPEEIANLCMTIIQTPYINGAVLEISGGYAYK